MGAARLQTSASNGRGRRYVTAKMGSGIAGVAILADNAPAAAPYHQAWNAGGNDKHGDA